VLPVRYELNLCMLCKRKIKESQIQIYVYLYSYLFAYAFIPSICVIYGLVLTKIICTYK
jgi:hypothetical protein